MMSKKATIKKVDDSSWLVIDQHRGNVGVLYQNVQGHYEYLSNDIKEDFTTEREVEKFFRAKVFKNEAEDVVTPDKMYIAGFEIPFPSPELVSADHPEFRKDLPLFSKTANSDQVSGAQRIVDLHRVRR